MEEGGPSQLDKCWNVAPQTEGEPPREGVKRKGTGFGGTGREGLAQALIQREGD